jgi:ABC-type Fe3+-hydroxamate transport system substrate-binding protein
LIAHLPGVGDGRFRWRLLAALLFALLAACGSPAGQPRGGLVVVDDAGDTVRLARPASRVVSLSPATTELVFAIGAGDRLVGRTRWCDYPEAARAVPDVGDGIPPNVETVLAARPDLVLLYRSPQNLDAAARFRAAGSAVLQIDFNHLADVARVARLLGPLLDRTRQGDSLAADMDRQLAALQPGADSGSHPNVLILAWDQPPMAIGAGSFQSEILTLAGGRNIFADISAPSATVSIEAIAARNPNLVLISDSGVPGFAQRPEWKVIPAVRDRRFVRLTTPAFGRPSPRAPELVRELRRRLAEAAP